MPRDYAAMGRKGAMALHGGLTPEQRSANAQHAINVRWAMYREFGSYPRRGTPAKRIDFHIRALMKLMGYAMLEKDYKEARACITALAQFERLKIWLEGSQGRNAVPLEPEISQQTEGKLAEARAKREAAAVEVEVDAKSEKG